MMKIKILILIGLVLLGSSCSDEFLEKTPDKALAVPDQLSDLRALLENNNMFTNIPGLSDLGCDDYSLSYSNWSTKEQAWRNAYIWKGDIFEGLNSNDWTQAYEQIYVCNVVLEKLEEDIFLKTDSLAFNEVKGNALLYRAIYYLALAETFGQPYNEATADVDEGIPLKIDSDIETVAPVAKVKEVFDQITTDLIAAADCLPATLPEFNLRYRGSKVAAYGLLARTFLIMQDFVQSKKYADLCLLQHNYLYDYNLLDTTLTRPFTNIQNEEILLLCYQISRNLHSSSSTFIADDLLNSYQEGDLRKSVFYRFQPSTGTYYFRGQYSGNLLAFAGISTDEVYLIRAEANSRLGNLDDAESDLQFFYTKRWDKNYPLPKPEESSLLQTILSERRKELIFRGLRWSDLRRLNQEETTSVHLYRSLNGQEYDLPPNDDRYTYPMPTDELIMRGLNN